LSNSAIEPPFGAKNRSFDWPNITAKVKRSPGLAVTVTGSLRPNLTAPLTSAAMPSGMPASACIWRPLLAGLPSVKKGLASLPA